MIRRADDAGIHPLVAPAESLSSSKTVLQIAADHPSVLPCVGVHPHKANTFEPSQIPAFEEMAARPEVIGIGEIGLDYFYEFSERNRQIETLSFFINLATRLDKPVCLHVRDKNGQPGASTDLLSLLRPLTGKIRGVVHCFTGTYAESVSFLDLGLHISFTGILTFKKADTVREVFCRLPPDRILLETDSPYLAPAPRRGIRNEPLFLKQVFSLAAEIRHLDESDWSAQLRRNQQTLFGDRCV